MIFVAEHDERVVELVARAEKVSLQWVLHLMKTLSLNAGKGIKNTVTHIQTTGEQRYSQLKKSGSLEHVDIAKTDLSALKTELKRHKVDFAIRYNKETGKHHVFFKAKDRDTLNLALENVIAKFSQEKEAVKEKPPVEKKKPSLDERLKQAQEKANNINDARSKEKAATKGKGQER